MPEDLQDRLCCSAAPSTLAFYAHSPPGHSQGSATLSAGGCPGLPQPMLSSTRLSASNEPKELTSNLITAQFLPAYPASERGDGSAPSSPGNEDTTDSGPRLSSQPVPGQDESISKEPVIISQPRLCSLSHEALARRSVSFWESPKILPSCTNGNWKESPFGPHGTPNADGTLDLSQLGDFLDREMLSRVNGQGGLDVTSPDHVYVFCRANSTAVYDLEKTMMDPAFLARTQEESDSPFAAGQVLSGRSERSSRQYGSCDSQCYVSATEASDHSEPKKCLEGKDSLAGGETPCCSSSLHATDESADSNRPGSTDGISRVRLHKRQGASTIGQSLEELVEEPAAQRAVVGRLAPSRSQDAEISGGRHLRASFEASHGSDLTSAGKPASEVRTCSTENESLKDPRPSRPSQALQAHLVSLRDERASSFLSARDPHQLTPADLAVEEFGPREAVSSVNGQVVAEWDLRGKVRKMRLSADNSLFATAELSTNQWVARQADIPKWEPSANGSDPDMLDTVPLGRATSGTSDTVLLDGAEEEMNGTPCRGGWVKPPCLSSEADTVVIQRLASPAKGSAEDEFPLSNEKETMTGFPTKSFLSPLLQVLPGPCHVTPRTKSRLTSAVRDSNHSSLFEKTLEMPRRPRRVRSPQRTPVGPATCLEGSPARGSWVAQGEENASHWEGEEMHDLDAAKIIAKATSCSGSSRDDSNNRDASPTVLLDSAGGARPSEFVTDEQSLYGNNREAESGAACRPGVPLHPTSSDTARSPSASTEEGDGTDLMQKVALLRPLSATAFSQAESEAASGERERALPSRRPHEETQHPGLDATRQASSSRISFSRVSRRPSQATSASDHLAGRLSPVPDPCGQDFPLSPGGRPVNLSAREPVEYLYMDEEEGYALIERHVPCVDDVSVLTDTTSSDDTIIYDWRAYQSKLAGQDTKENQPLQHGSPKATSKLHLLSDEALIRKLRNLGANPGPVTSLTRKIYVQLLDKLMTDPNAKARKRSAGHSPELASALETFQIPDCKEDEMALARQFDQPDKNRKWREGVLKSSFNYLLLDPRHAPKCSTSWISGRAGRA
uniref:LEM domain-containing protein n=1 Tax=Pelusios castaneus TaxID=367368 RepID=A0A8C8S2H8_9SAUR